MDRTLVIALVIALQAPAYAAAPSGDAPLGASPPAAAQTPPASSARQAPAPRTSDRCYTTAANCILPDRQNAGSECWCVTPFGPSFGRVR